MRFNVLYKGSKLELTGIQAYIMEEICYYDKEFADIEKVIEQIYQAFITCNINLNLSELVEYFVENYDTYQSIGRDKFMEKFIMGN